MVNRPLMDMLTKISKLLSTPGINDEQIQKLLQMIDAFGDPEASMAIRYEINERFHGRGQEFHNSVGNVKNRV